MNLQSLLPEGRRLLTKEFLHGEREPLSEQEFQDVVVAIERPISVDGFLAAIPRRLPRQKADVDGDIAIAIHKSLPLHRREAADVGVWRYLAVVVAPEFIRLRWRAEEETFRSRFWRPGTRPDSNYYSRLWWIAELTAGADHNYDRTRKALGSQALANAIFVRRVSHYFPAVKACIDVLSGEESNIIHRVIREFYRELALLPREALTEHDIADLLRSELARAPRS